METLIAALEFQALARRNSGGFMEVLGLDMGFFGVTAIAAARPIFDKLFVGTSALARGLADGMLPPRSTVIDRRSIADVAQLVEQRFRKP
jgi:hypothetical protein